MSGSFKVPLGCGGEVEVVAISEYNRHPMDPPGGVTLGRSVYWLEMGGCWLRLPVRSMHGARELVQAMVDVSGLVIEDAGEGACKGES